jgi:hypothetical protein
MLFTAPGAADGAAGKERQPKKPRKAAKTFEEGDRVSCVVGALGPDFVDELAKRLGAEVPRTAREHGTVIGPCEDYPNQIDVLWDCDGKVMELPTSKLKREPKKQTRKESAKRSASKKSDPKKTARPGQPQQNDITEQNDIAAPGAADEAAGAQSAGESGDTQGDLGAPSGRVNDSTAPTDPGGESDIITTPGTAGRQNGIATPGAANGAAGAQSVGEVGARMDVHDVSLDSDDLDDDPLADKPPPNKTTVAELQKQLAARGLK